MNDRTTTNAAHWAGSNAERRAAGAASQIVRITAALRDIHPSTTRREIESARLRLRHPKLSLREIAVRNGMTKDQYWSLLNRFLSRHQYPAHLD